MPPPTILINEMGDILHIYGKTGDYLEPPSGKPIMNIFSMAKAGLKSELTRALQYARMKKESIAKKNIAIKSNSKSVIIDLHIKPILHKKDLKNLYLIYFIKKEKKPKSLESNKQKVKAKDYTENEQQLKQEIKDLKEQMQIAIEEYETAQEELKSANEELQSYNEELQSINEELSTSKEELQSLNEELITVNAELQNKNEQLSSVYNDMVNFFNSTEIPVLYLNKEFRVKRFTPAIHKIFNLRESDIERPITDFDTKIMYDNFIDDIKQVLNNLQILIKQIQTKNKEFFNMRIIPYKTIEGIIEGVVISLTDITEMKRLENQLKQSNFNLRYNYGMIKAVLENTKDLIVFLDENFQLIKASSSILSEFKLNPQQFQIEDLYNRLESDQERSELQQVLNNVISKEQEVIDYQLTIHFSEMEKTDYHLSAKKMTDYDEAKLILMVFHKI